MTDSDTDTLLRGGIRLSPRDTMEIELGEA